MIDYPQEGQYRVNSVGRWKVTSRRDSAIHVEELEMTDELRRSLTADGVTHLPGPRLERYRRFWNLPRPDANRPAPRS